jgi:3-phosphoshikimate 1-carboxyvinyltransferase
VAPLKSLTVHGEVTPPGDKSISHRALMLAAVTRGKSRITGILDSADVRSTALVLRALGAGVPPIGDTMLVTGRAARFLSSSADPLDCGNSGTTARIMAGIVAGAGLTAMFEGDASLSRRPMRRIAEPLRAMGAHVSLAPGGGLPMGVAGGPLRSLDWQSPVASAQVKSAILLAATLGGVQASVEEPHRSRDHTERMLAARGVVVHVDGLRVGVPPAQVLHAVDAAVPADPSSAAFFVALAVLGDKGEVAVRGVCLNDTRTGFFRVLKRMGADLEVTDEREEGGERVGTIIARPSSLRGVAIAADEVPSLIDELPLFACLAARAEGESEVRGAGELRVKESDRIRLIVGNLRDAGASAEEFDDGFRVSGSDEPLCGNVTTAGDHRVAMSFGVLGKLPGNDLAIDDRGCVEVSFPHFWSELERITS